MTSSGRGRQIDEQTDPMHPQNTEWKRQTDKLSESKLINSSQNVRNL